MKIKHWQGYGTVNATKIYKGKVGNKNVLKVKVSGDHEWGLVRRDAYDLINWLVKKFEKNEVPFWDFSYGYEVIDDENVIYTFTY